MALVLAVIFTPITGRLEPYVGRILSAALVVLFAVGAIIAIGYFLTIELTIVVDEVSGYSDNISNKLGALERPSPPWLQHLRYVLSSIQRRVHKDTPAPIARDVIQAVPMPPTMHDNLRPVLPILDGVVEGLLVIVLMFFLLYSRRDLRDRMVRLTARARITIAPQAVETAAQTVCHYLLLFSITNLGFATRHFFESRVRADARRIR